MPGDDVSIRYVAEGFPKAVGRFLSEPQFLDA